MKRFLLLVSLLGLILFSGGLPQTLEAQQLTMVRVFIDLPSKTTNTDRLLINNASGRIRWEFQTSNTISIEVPEQALPILERLSNRFGNIRIEPKATVVDTLDWGVDKIDAERVWGGADKAINVVSGGNAGSGMKVAVIDTGIQKNHPDLSANIKGGWNFVGGANNTAYDDGHGHGTHVAGTVAAADNGIGRIGVAPQASIYALRVLDNTGSGSFGDIVKAIEWATGLNGGTKMDVINLSLGCYYAPAPSACHDPAMQAAVDAAYAAGVVVVAAAGNSGAGTDTVGYPAQYSSVIAVASTTSTNGLSSFSSTGPAVEIAAPGSSISSTYLNSTYATMSGTSMATPHVAGLAALIKAANPSFSASQIRTTMQQTATDLGSSGRDNQFGYGLVNAPAAVGTGSGSPTPTPTPPPATSTTAWLNCSSQAAVTSSSGDNNGFQTDPLNACTDGNGHAADDNSGTGTSSSCTNGGKDRHVFSGYSAPVGSGASIVGIEVRLDAWADSTSSSPKMCVQLSWNGGTSWTSAKQTSRLTTGEQSHILGGAADTWGRTWTASELSDANFRVRVIDVAGNTGRDFRLDWASVRITTTGGTPVAADETSPTVTGTSPVNGATGVATSSTVTATFSEPLQASTVNTNTFSLSGPGGSVAGNVSYNGSTATFTPSSALANSATYTLSLGSGIQDLAGNPLSPVSRSFTTAAVSATPTPTATPTSTPSPSPTPTSTPSPTPTATPPPGGGTTAWLNCTVQAAVTTGSGDNNGFQTNPMNACADAGSYAEDTSSGTGTSTSCTGTDKDRHIFSSYNVPVAGGATIAGIEVRLDALSNATGGKMCVELSWDGGVNWTAAKEATGLTKSETPYILGGAGDTWGRTWTASELSNTNFRIRVTNVASNTSSTFRLDWVTVRITTN